MSAIVWLLGAGGVAYLASRNLTPRQQQEDLARIQNRREGAGNGGGVQRPAPMATRLDQYGQVIVQPETAGPQVESPPAAPPPSPRVERRESELLTSEKAARPSQVIAADAKTIQRIITKGDNFGRRAGGLLQYIARIRATEYAGGLDLGGGRMLTTGQDVRAYALREPFDLANTVEQLTQAARVWATGASYPPGSPATIEGEQGRIIAEFNRIINLIIGNERRLHSTRRG